MVQKIILQCFQESVREEEEDEDKSVKEDLRRIEELKHCGSIACCKSRGVTERLIANCERRWKSNPLPKLRFYVLITPLLGSCLGRQGSSGSASWANTESSPEEQVLFESWQVGEYCSKGTARSRYSCQRRGQRLDRQSSLWSHK